MQDVFLFIRSLFFVLRPLAASMLKFNPACGLLIAAIQRVLTEQHALFLLPVLEGNPIFLPNIIFRSLSARSMCISHLSIYKYDMQIEGRGYRFRMGEIKKEKDSLFNMPARTIIREIEADSRQRSSTFVKIYRGRISLYPTNSRSHKYFYLPLLPVARESAVARKEPSQAVRAVRSVEEKCEKHEARFESREFGNSRICHYDTSGRYH